MISIIKMLIIKVMGDVDHQGVDQEDNTTKGESTNSCVIPHNKLMSEAAFFRSCLWTYYRMTGNLMEEKVDKSL